MSALAMEQKAAIVAEFTRITNAVAAEFGMTPGALVQPGRSDNRTSFVKGVAMLLARERTGAGDVQIGTFFSLDRCSVYQRVRSVRDVVSVYRSERAHVEAVREKLQSPTADYKSAAPDHVPAQ